MLIFSSVSVSHSQFFCEDFEYPSGDTINQYGWVKFSGLGINPVLITGPGLEMSCHTVTFGNTIKLQETGEDSYKFLPQVTDSGTIYVSFLVKFLIGRTGDCFFHLGDSVGNNSNKIARVYAKERNGNIAIGLAKDNENPKYADEDCILGETYLVVLKYEFVSGNDNDLVSLYLYSEDNCPTCEDPGPPAVAPFGVGENDLPNIGKIVLQQGAASKSATLLIDAICVDKIFCSGALPIELGLFTSSISNERNVVLNWSTMNEVNNSGFEIERSVIGSVIWKKQGYVIGNGTTEEITNYSFTDAAVPSGTYQYRLKQIDYNGNYEYHNLNNEVIIGVPIQFDLFQNYPNPFNPSTKIGYAVSIPGNITLKIYTVSGMEVATVVNETKTAGYYVAEFTATNLSSGIYFYKLSAGNFTGVKKMILIK